MAVHPAPVPLSTFEIDFRIPDDGIPTLVCRGRMTIETCGTFKSEIKKWVPLSKLVIVDLSQIRLRSGQTRKKKDFVSNSPAVLPPKGRIRHEWNPRGEIACEL